MITNRRSLLIGAATFLAAPAIVRASSIMQVRSRPFDGIILDPQSDRFYIQNLDLERVENSQMTMQEFFELRDRFLNIAIANQRK